MCYFSDEKRRKELISSPFRREDLNLLANAFFSRALKLQIGCGAEPSLFAHNKLLIELAKSKNVPYISMTTNANLFQKEQWSKLLEAGLDEITISLHGIHKESYEYFMQGADYDRFLASLHSLSELKILFPKFNLRINYTINEDNLLELSDFFNVLGKYRFDIIQLRPVQKIGESDYNNFSWEKILSSYDEIIAKLKSECQKREITFLAPAKNDLIKQSSKLNAVIDATYIYISPRVCWQYDFNLEHDTFNSYSRKHHLGLKLLKNIIFPRQSTDSTTKKLNYDIS
jgi:molybdenum cofactor biosynthesis enzyme MoaA